MSDQLKRSLWWIPHFATAICGLWGLILISVSGGEFLNEVRGLRKDIIRIEQGMAIDREEMMKLFREVQTAQRAVERRVEILELFNGNHATRGVK